MQNIPIIFMGLATNLDNLCIGMAIGIMGKKISFFVNLMIAFLSGGVTFCCCLFASSLTVFGRAPNVIGGILLMLVGLFSFLPSKEETDLRLEKNETKISPGEGITIGLALAVNCFAAALGAGMTGLGAIPTGSAVFIFSFLSVGFGNVIGRKSGREFKKETMDAISGIVMVILGIVEMFI